MTKQHTGTRAQVQWTDRTLPLELTAEFVLPDYQSEISRLLWVRPTLLPPERFIGGGKADFSGSIRFEVLYVGPDGALYAAEPENTYSFTLPLEDIRVTDGVEICAEPVADAVVSRVTGPRKLSVRCRMHARVQGFISRDLAPEVKGGPTEAERLCRLCEVAECSRYLGCGRESVTLTDRVEVEGTVRMITARGNVFLPEVIAGQNEVRCSGEVEVTLLLCREEEESTPYTLTRRIPFSQSVPLEGLTPEARPCATGTVCEVGASVGEDGITLAPRLLLCAEGQTCEPIVLTKDLFAPGHTADCHHTQEPLRRDVFCGNRHFSITGERPLSDLGIGSETEILDVTAEAEIREKVPDGSRFSLVGELHCHVLHRRGGEYGVLDVPLPFRVQAESGSEDMSLQCAISACRVSILRDVLRADAELQLAIRATAPAPVQVLHEVALTPTAEQSSCDGPMLYYPTKGETLWAVAKRHALSPADLAIANGLSDEAPGSPDSLCGKKFLLIS